MRFAMIDGLPLPRRYLAIAALSAGTALAVIDGGIATVALGRFAPIDVPRLGMALTLSAGLAFVAAQLQPRHT